MNSRREFLRLAVGTACATTPLLFALSSQRMTERKICDCGEKNVKLMPGRRGKVCWYCASADEANHYLFLRGLRPCPHSWHSSDEDFSECASSLGGFANVND